MKKTPFVFFGTPRNAAETLEFLKRNGYLPSLIVTASDMPVGRKQIITPPPVKIWALKNNIPILQPEKLHEEFKKQLSTFNFEVFIVVAYGKIFPEWLLNLPAKGTYNIHYSLLPKYRGASPVQGALLEGEKETGVTIQRMVKELDAGPIIAQGKTKIEPNETMPELLEQLTKLGSELLIKTLDQNISSIIPTEQDHTNATFSSIIKKEDGLINLNNAPEKNWNKYRAYKTWPGVYYFIEKDGQKIRIIIKEATFENEIFTIKKVLPEGKKEMSYEDFLRGLK